MGDDEGDWMTSILLFVVAVLLYYAWYVGVPCIVVLMVYGCYELTRELITDFRLWVLVALVGLSSATILLSLQWGMVIGC